MRRVLVEIRLLSPSSQPYLIFFPPPPPSEPGGFSLNNKVSPSILLIIVILAVIFFVSGLVHLLVRLLLRPQIREPDDADNVTALQGQLQQLFHLHDSGVDQSFIDALPVFNYKAIIGVKDPFDCAVCLCEFEADNKLRLLPKCSHAFHMDCIDTWLLSQSTCPLCRASLLPDFSQSTSFSPVVLVLESGGESAREISSEEQQGIIGRTGSIARVSSRLGSHREDLRPVFFDSMQKSSEVEEKNHGEISGSGEKVLQVKLGKFKNVDRGESSNDDTSSDARRCFSMGSFAYVMDENSPLQVPVRTLNKQPSKKPYLPLTPGHRHVLSECGCDEFTGINAFKIPDSKPIRKSSKDSFSVSKIWIRGRKDELKAEPSRRAVSFRFPEPGNPASGDEVKDKNARRTTSEIHISRWSSELGVHEGARSSFSPDSQANPNPPSFARRTLLWLMGRPNRAVHSSA